VAYVAVDLDATIAAHACPSHAHMHEAVLFDPEVAVVDATPYDVGGGRGVGDRH
jgi:hypothetical protein